MGDVINFLKYQVTRDVVNPTNEYIENISVFLKKYNRKNELAMLNSFQKIFNVYTKELEKANWDEFKTPVEIWTQMQEMTNEIDDAVTKCIAELGLKF